MSLVLQANQKVVTVRNVFAVIEGSIEPDRYSSHLHVNIHCDAVQGFIINDREIN